jgi:lactoylglutathione lyase
MDLGAMSVSLAVADLAASTAFYARLGFSPVMGDQTAWTIMRNGDHTIGLFQGMFESNLLTFSPGWDAQAQPVGSYTDVRDIQRQLKADGVALLLEVDEATTGPGFVMLSDPDGNTILIDQHV